MLLLNDYYVYEHIRNDNNTCFYVGKGRNRRAEYKTRNEHHDRIVKKYGMHVNIIKDNLSEEEAYKLEEETIRKYVFELGYGIDIIGYNNKKVEPGHLTNHTFGGEKNYGRVHTEEWKERHSLDMMGEKNPAYGVNYWETFLENKKDEIKSKISKASSGKNNPMYGISPKNRMNDETYKNWYNKKVEQSQGSKNPNYGNDKLRKKLENNPELKLKYYSRPGGQNGRAKGVILYDVNWNYIDEFDCMTNCAKWIKEKENIKTGINCMITNIRLAIENNHTYKNYNYKFK